MSSHWRLSMDGPLASLTLERPEKKNALIRADWRALPELLAQITQNSAVRVLLLRGSGRTFSAGADIAELQANMRDGEWLQGNHADVQQAQQALYRFTLPSVAVLQGAVFGGGLGLALACDFRLAQNDASFALTPAKLGLQYSLADTRRLCDVVGPARARELLFCAEPWSAYQALTFGLLHEVHAPNTLQARVASLCEQLAKNSPSAIAAIKQTLLDIADGQGSETPESRARFAAAFQSADFAEGARAFLDKRTPQF
jgi:enoyl-CoA hydratase